MRFLIHFHVLQMLPKLKMGNQMGKVHFTVKEKKQTNNSVRKLLTQSPPLFPMLSK